MCGHDQGTDRGGKRQIALDLSEVTLADRDAVTFLAVYELKGIELRNCPVFLRWWVTREQARLTP
jgi:hypothetical protein